MTKQKAPQQVVEGIPAAIGIAIGPAFLYESPNLRPTRKNIEDTESELARLKKALCQAEAELEAIHREAQESIGEDAAKIFIAHRAMLKDPDLMDAVERKIQTEKINAEAAFFEAAETYAEILQNLADATLQGRAADVRDISARVIRILSNKKTDESQLSVPSIIIAEDLSPSDTVRFKRENVLGFFTSSGGATSHTAILSRALGIPAIVGAREIPASITEKTTLILDGTTGKLIVDPDKSALSEYRKKQQLEIKQQEDARLEAASPAITKDGKRVKVVANIGNLEDANNALLNGAEGAGLFRTEFSYIKQTSIPSEEALVSTYQDIFRVFEDNQPVVVRTLDIGGDKEIPHLGLPVETNAFLGRRGIRLCFSRLDLFKPQLRAILRAGCHSNLCIMFPMISTVEEIRQARELLKACMAELKAEQMAYNQNPQVGIMIETPSAVICADQMAKEVDFFSIGTNDLAQYTLAADRTNPHVSHLISAMQPAVLRLVKRTVDCAHAEGIWVGMCGEMAGEPSAIPILLGMGLDEFSMSPPAIPKAKEIIRKCDYQKTKLLADSAVLCQTPDEVEALVSKWSKDRSE